MSARTPLVAANWKMNLLSEDARAWCRGFASGLASLGGVAADVVVFPSFPLLPAVAAGLERSPAEVGGQDLSPQTEGAFTGDVSPPQLADAGCRWALCGHSERRHGHGEGDGLVGRKVAAARAAGLVPVLCVGETAEERDAGRTEEVLERQLSGGLASLEAADWKSGTAPLVLAYEPVWAIGTGQTATPGTAAEAHGFLRRRLEETAGREAASAVRILYGGSVKPDNAAELILPGEQADVDGFLVGGASLDPESFLTILRTAASKP